MRKLLLCLLLTLAGCHQAAVNQGYIRETAVHPFPEASEVRLLVGEPEYTLRDGVPIHPGKPGRLLTPEQRRQFEALLKVLTPVDLSPQESREFGAMAACFIPHHFFQYFDARGHQIGEIAVCFCCGGIEMAPDRLNLKDDRVFSVNYAKLEPLVQSWGERTNIDCD